MKVLILHLSDIHFYENNNLSEDNTSGIINIIKAANDISTVIIIVSGDIAFSGKRAQYNIAYRFLDKIRKSTKNFLENVPVYFEIVPGNHDIDYTSGEWNRYDLEKNFEKYCDTKISSEMQKMRNFYNHAKGLGCFTNKNLVQVNNINIGGHQLQFNLVNTAVYSLKNEEDQGFHYLPQNELDKLKTQNKSDFVFSIMHHPHHWYHSSMKKELEKILYEGSNVLYVGHEHYSSTMGIEMNNANVAIFAGGELSNRGDWTNSEFYMGILDLDNREYVVDKYKWNSHRKIYVSIDETRTTLERKRTNIYGLFPKKEYLDDLLQDRKYMISDRFVSYYVFPNIEEIVMGEKRVAIELSELEAFIQKIELKKKIIVVGRNASGKTVLLKRLFDFLIDRYCVLYIHAQDIGDYNKVCI